MKLILQHCANVDIAGGYWNDPIDAKLTSVNVSSALEARAAFVAWRDRNGLGGGNMARKCGELWEGPKKLLGKFSYNGRFWEAASLSSDKRVEIIL